MMALPADLFMLMLADSCLLLLLPQADAYAFGVLCFETFGLGRRYRKEKNIEHVITDPVMARLAKRCLSDIPRNRPSFKELRVAVEESVARKLAEP